MKQVYVIAGQVYINPELPHSEVCMHMRIAGQPMAFRLDIVSSVFGNNTPNGGIAQVQLLDANGSHFSSPILASEAGLYYESETKRYYYYSKDSYDN